jgi:hypothetical protein
MNAHLKQNVTGIGGRRFAPLLQGARPWRANGMAGTDRLPRIGAIGIELLVTDDLTEIARCCQQGEAIDERLTRWLGGALARFLTQDTRRLEEAMGLQAPQGGVPWHLEEALRQRDAVLRPLPACSL